MNDNKIDILKSKSGIFYTDKNGMVQRFEPSWDNPFLDDKTEINSYYTFTTHKSIHTFIVPKGVKGFETGFMHGVKVFDRFELPEGLISMGEDCFTNCILPMVVIPQSVFVISNFAFGHSHIDSLQISTSLRSPYGRQFKDAYIKTLRLPKEWINDISIDDGDRLILSETFDSEGFGYLRWPSTHVERLEFYARLT